MLYEELAGRISVTTDVGVLEVGHRKDVDSKAMRKVEEGQDVAMVIENSAVSSGTTVYKHGRLLIKLH